MQYIIYGINRQAKDFLYVFQDLDILCVTDDKIEKGNAGKGIWEKYSVRNLADILTDYFDDNSNIYIVICGCDKTSKVKRLESSGLIYGKDY